MAGSKIIDGTPVDAATTNAALLAKTADDTFTGILTGASVAVASGSQVDNIQGEHNSIASFVGKTLNSSPTDLPTYVYNEGFTPNDPIFQRLDDVSDKFNSASGHLHDGTAGSGGPIDSTVIQSVILRGFYTRGLDLTGASGGFTDVTSQFNLSTPSTSSLLEGVVVNVPYNRVILRQASGINTGEPFTDGFGNEVYGRLTESTGTWTLTYYVDIGGTETAYSFASASDVAIYYQSLFNPIVNAPVYSPEAFIQSENLTETVVDATFTQAGKVSITSQGFGGLKTFKNGIGYVVTEDSATTGASGSVPAATANWIELTNVSLSSINALATPNNGEIRIVTNNTGNDVTILNDNGSPSTNRIITGTGNDLTLSDQATLFLAYDSYITKWRVVGGSGGGNTDSITFTLANNQVSAANVSGFVVSSSTNKAFTTDYSIVRRYTGNLPIQEDATFSTNGGTLSTWLVYFTVVQPDGKILVGGPMTAYNGTSVGKFTRINSDGTLDTTFNTNLGTGYNAVVFSFLLQSDNKIIVSGVFNSFNGNTRNGLNRLNSDGTEDTAFYTNLGTGLDATALNFGELSDGTIVVGGQFTDLNGNTRLRLLKLNSDGTENTTFYTNLGTAFNGPVDVVKVQSDDKIVVAGNFTTFNGNTRNYAVRLNADGTEDTAFYTNLGTAFNNTITNGAIDPTTGDIYFSGTFTTFNGNSRSRIVKVDSTGTEIASFYTNLGTAFNGSIEGLALGPDDQVFVVGNFTTFNGNTRNRAVRLNPDGTEESTFVTALGTGFDVQLRDVHANASYDVSFVGDYTTFNGNARSKILKMIEQTGTTSDLVEVGTFSGAYKASTSTWSLIGETFSGDDAGVVFSITSGGQLQYTSSNLSGTLQESQAKFELLKL